MLVYLPSHNITADNIKEFILKYDKDFNRLLKSKQFVASSYESTFSFNQTEGLIVFNPILLNTEGILDVPAEFEYVNVRFQMGEKISKCFGVYRNEFLTEPTFIREPTLPEPASLFYIYSDVVSSSFMGGQQVNLLDVFPLKQSYAKTTNFTMYKNVSISSLDSISIKITDQNGEDPKLKDDVNVVLVIHFKRVFD